MIWQNKWQLIYQTHCAKVYRKHIAKCENQKLKIRFSSCVLCASVHHLWVSRIFLFDFVCDSHYYHSNVAVKYKRKRTKQKATWMKMKNKAATNQCIQFWQSTQRCSPGALVSLFCSNWSLISMKQALLELVIMNCWNW